MSKKPVTSITVSYNTALVTLENIPNDIAVISGIFSSIADQKINIDMISQTPPYKGNISLSFTISSEDLMMAISEMNKFKKDIPNLQIEIDSDNTKVSIYGEEMKNLSGVAARLFGIMAKIGVEIKLVTTSEVDISYLIYEKDVDRVIEAVKKEFEL